MSGLQEILIIILIILVILFVPCRMGSHPSEQRSSTAGRKRISGIMRLKAAFSLLWLITAVLWRRPWENGWIPFFAVGVLPLLIFWVAQWVFSGFTKSNE